MATSEMEKDNVFCYGFLSSHVSKVLEDYPAMDEKAKDTIDETEKFMEKIISGERLISRRSEDTDLAPSIESLRAFRYALETLEIMESQKSGDIKEPEKDLGEIFQNILETLKNVLKNKPKESIKNQLSFTSSFFSTLDNILLQKAVEFSRQP